MGTFVALAALAYGVYAGEEQKKTQKKAAQRTRQAHEEALRQQMIERQRSAQLELRQNRPSPASSVVMNDALGTPTDKTGGVDDRLRLSRSTKLGGGT